MKAIVDCNSFYCSCEKVFRPALEHTPVVVLSNNDGCIISRTDEAKALGVKMTGPFFMAKDIIEENNVAVFSSNYNLYSHMSQRVMDTLKETVGENNVEVYSVDEAFLNLKELCKSNFDALAAEIKTKVEQWTGVQVSVGIAPTKTLAKMANYLAKKNKQETGCVTVLDTDKKITEALQKVKVNKIWGVGSRFAEKLQALGICTAWDLYSVSEEWARKHLGGVVGVRLIKELHGEEALLMQEQLQEKKMITTSRMFGNALTDIAQIKEAVATYTSRAAEKLRRQHCAASVINVFIVVKEDKPARPEEGKNVPFKLWSTLATHTILPTPTALTHELIKPAMQMVDRIFQPGKRYSKAGVILSGLVPDDSIQANLFHSSSKNVNSQLMNMLDNINFSMRGDVVKFAASGISRNWKMRQQYISPRYTSRWEELCEVR